MPSAPKPPESPKPARAVDYIDRLALGGRYHFTTEQAAEALGLSEIAARAAIRRLKPRGVIAAPMRGFHVFVSPEHRAAGCPPADQFLPELMALVGALYYIGLLSVPRRHGVGIDEPTATQVITHDNRPAIRCGDVRVAFIAKKNAAAVPVQMLATPRGEVAVSTPDATAVDLAAYPQHAGGLDGVALVLIGLADMLDPDKLVDAALHAELPSVQRLGYLLDRIGASAVTGRLAAYVASLAPVTTPLDPRRPRDSAPRDPRWRLAINTDVGA